MAKIVAKNVAGRPDEFHKEVRMWVREKIVSRREEVVRRALVDGRADVIAGVFGLLVIVITGQGKAAHKGDQLDAHERSIPPFRQASGQLGRCGQLETGRQGRYHVGHGDSSSVVSGRRLTLRQLYPRLAS